MDEGKRTGCRECKAVEKDINLYLKNRSYYDVRCVGYDLVTKMYRYEARRTDGAPEKLPRSFQFKTINNLKSLAL